MFSPHLELGAGSQPLQWVKLQHPLMTAGEKETRVDDFKADEKALAVAKTLGSPRGKLVVGAPGSANQVNREADRVAYVRKLWDTSSEDGESAHVAGCAQLLGVPAIGLRIIDGGEGEAAGVAIKFLEAWK
jgi:nucleoside phosphorylase